MKGKIQNITFNSITDEQQFTWLNRKPRLDPRRVLPKYMSVSHTLAFDYMQYCNMFLSNGCLSYVISLNFKCIYELNMGKTFQTRCCEWLYQHQGGFLSP